MATAPGGGTNDPEEEIHVPLLGVSYGLNIYTVRMRMGACSQSSVPVNGTTET